MSAIKPRRELRTVPRESTQAAAEFVAGLKESVVNPNTGTFDSTASAEFISNALNQSTVKVPETLQALLDEVDGAGQEKVVRAVLDGINEYETQHGCEVPPDLMEYAFHLAYGTTNDASKRYGIPGAALDSATSLHGDNLSLQPNRAIVAILAALSEAIPFAHYLPADIGSNEAKTGILSHLASKNYGMYAANGLMDGINSGDAYITSSRIDKVTVAAGAIPAGKLTSVQATRDTCAAAAGDVVTVNLLRGRSQVYIGGKVVAAEVTSNQGGSGNSNISGSVTIASTTYALGGTINTDTGVYQLTSTPMLPNGTEIIVEGFIDYDRMPSLKPTIITNVDMFTYYAKPWEVNTQVGIGSRTQMANELGLDAYSEGVIAIQNQFANERHYEVLVKALRLAANNTATMDMAWSTQGVQKTRQDLIQEMLGSILGAASQQMAIDTLAYGISHLYVGKYMAAQLRLLPNDIFQPSGIRDRAGIYRIGRLFGTYDVYYTPKILTDSNSASQILCVGRAPDVTRNPFVLGDAVSPTVIPLAVGTDLKSGAGFYARNFTEVNKHSPSASGCALISVTNMGL